jgi:hypothetical protein
VLDQVSFVALRMLIIHHHTRMAKTTCASICVECVPSSAAAAESHVIQLYGSAPNGLIECAKKLWSEGHYTCIDLLDYAEALNGKTAWVLRRIGKATAKSCMYCTASSNVRLRRCSRCNYIRYCSDECSRVNWPLHKTECNVISKSELLFDTSFRLLMF